MSTAAAKDPDEVAVDVDAPPERLWALLTDVTQMGRWSPECQRCEWLGGASGPAVGATFKGWNRRGVMRWSTVSRVTECVEPSLFTWVVDRSGMEWGYRFDARPDGAGTTVVEHRREVGAKPFTTRLAYKLGLLGKDPDAIVRRGMSETLDRLKAAAESAS